jgi:hypothetical protein
MHLKNVGALLNICGSIGMIVSLFLHAAQRIQFHPKLAMPITLAVVSMILSAFILCTCDPTTVLVLSSVSLVFPSIVLLSIGCVLMAMAVVQGIHSIQVPLFFLVLTALLAFSGNVIILAQE